MLAFVDHICPVDEHCKTCRDLEGGRKWRQNMTENFTVPDPTPDWACPLGKPWGWTPPVRPRMTIAQLIAANDAKARDCPACRRRREAAMAAGKGAT